MIVKGETLIKKHREKTVLFDLFTQIPAANVEIRGSFPLYHRDNEINSLGYRSDEFDQRAEMNVLSIGGGDVMGYGVNKAERFTDLFCNFLDKPTVNWNFGLPGKSNDYISRIASSVVPILRPDVILIVFEDIGRREFWDAGGRHFDYDPNPRSRRYYSSDENRLWNAHNNMSSHNEDFINFYKNYLLIEAMLSGFQIPWLFSWVNVSSIDQQVLSKAVDHSKFVGGFGKYDTGGDDIHCGPKSHKGMAEIFHDRFKG